MWVELGLCLCFKSSIRDLRSDIFDIRPTYSGVTSFCYVWSFESLNNEDPFCSDKFLLLSLILFIILELC